MTPIVWNLIIIVILWCEEKLIWIVNMFKRCLLCTSYVKDTPTKKLVLAVHNILTLLDDLKVSQVILFAYP